MIVKNEEQTLDRILSKVVLFADEIIVVDTGSQDNTINIAKKYTTNVYSYMWQNDFSKARNESFRYATKDYIMWLDADDYIDTKNALKLKRLKQYIVDEDVIMLPYNVYFDNFGNTTFSYFRERIVKNNGTFYFVDPVHEVIVPHGKIVHKNIPIMHKKLNFSNPRRNLDIYLQLKKQNYSFNPRNRFYFACEYYYNGLYSEAIKEFNIFLSLNNGYVENKIQACLNLCRIYIIKKQYNNAIHYALNSFKYDTPRPEVLCELGYIYLLKQEYKKAIYWYKLAICKTKKIAHGGFVEVDAGGYIPYIQIGLCYYYLKEYKKAYKYNALALKQKPNCTKALNNQKIYLSLINNKTSN